MAVSLCSPTSYEVLNWDAAQNPSAIGITIPSDCDCVVLFVAGYNSSNDDGVNTATLSTDGSRDYYHEKPNFTGNSPCNCAAIWMSPTTGSQNIQITMDSAQSEGISSVVCYLKGVDTTSDVVTWQGDGYDGSEPTISISGLTNGETFLLFHDCGFDTGTTEPTLLEDPENYINIVYYDETNTLFENQDARLSYKFAEGTTQSNGSGSNDWSTILILAFAPAGTGPGPKSFGYTY